MTGPVPALARTMRATPYGQLTLTASKDGLTAISWWPSEVVAGASPDVPHDPSHPVLVATVEQLAAYADGSLRQFELPLDLQGTPFQISVWRHLTRIPYGQTCTYGRLAALIGRPRAARAVGAAVGRNPLSIVVPCHRVVGADGSLTGFAGGLDVKRSLLEHEADANQCQGLRRSGSWALDRS